MSFAFSSVAEMRPSQGIKPADHSQGCKFNQNKDGRLDTDWLTTKNHDRYAYLGLAGLGWIAVFDL
jgi:hypothetical protein